MFYSCSVTAIDTPLKNRVSLRVLYALQSICGKLEKKGIKRRNEEKKKGKGKERRKGKRFVEFSSIRIYFALLSPCGNLVYISFFFPLPPSFKKKLPFWEVRNKVFHFLRYYLVFSYAFLIVC